MIYSKRKKERHDAIKHEFIHCSYGLGIHTLLIFLTVSVKWIQNHVYINVEIDRCAKNRRVNMEYSSIRLTDLPDEILMIIFQKLKNIELLYYLTDVNPRLDCILNESIFTNRLVLLRFISGHLVDSKSLVSCRAYPLLDPILDRFCERILPKINIKIRWLELESTSMERVLHAANYPNLFGFALYNIQTERALEIFSGKMFHFV